MWKFILRFSEKFRISRHCGIGGFWNIWNVENLNFRSIILSMFISLQKKSWIRLCRISVRMKSKIEKAA